MLRRFTSTTLELKSVNQYNSKIKAIFNSSDIKSDITDVSGGSEASFQNDGLYDQINLVLTEDAVLVSAATKTLTINGVASILLTLLIDPKSAMITDQALRGKRPYGDVKALVVLLITSKLIGTLLGQVLFLPAAQVITSFYK